MALFAEDVTRPIVMVNAPLAVGSAIPSSTLIVETKSPSMSWLKVNTTTSLGVYSVPRVTVTSGTAKSVTSVAPSVVQSFTSNVKVGVALAPNDPRAAPTATARKVFLITFASSVCCKTAFRNQNDLEDPSVNVKCEPT